jgi:S-ribosylhomocysteine lyase LuxS involved in autoinducer biosynthesis
MTATAHTYVQSHSNQDSELLRQLNFIPGLKEILLVRQVHALEHATVWILGGTPRRSAYQTRTVDDERFGGMSTATGFYLIGDVDTETLQHAVAKALHRLIAGETHLAVHPRCGTNLSVALTLSAGLAMGAHVILPKDPIAQFFGLGAALTLTAQLTPPIGDWMQANVTTAIPFNLMIQDVQALPQQEGRPLHFVRTQWREFS